MISNPNIVSLFNDIKDMAKQSEYKQVIFLNPLRYLFSEEYSSAKHWGIYKDCYGTRYFNPTQYFIQGEASMIDNNYV